MQEVKVVARTFEVEDNKGLNEDLTFLAGKAAGVCYMPDNYLDEGIQNEEKAMKRALNCSKSGHHSVYDHGHITFVIKTNKMMAMILNSVGVYTTSEKSARYTVMKPETELELTLYNKWKKILEKAILDYYPDMDEPSAYKLAMENARYMISVFTPTTMEYTISFRQAFLLADYLEKLSINCQDLQDDFSKRVGKDAKELAELLRENLGETRLHDNKNQCIRFLEYQRHKELYSFDELIDKKKDIIGDVYSINYLGTFAMLAQAQRHRTIRYTMYFDGNCDNFDFYVPKIVDISGLHEEWLDDIRSVAYCYPQGTMVLITEQGLFEDFALKCKERLCGRAQLEIADLTATNLEQFTYDMTKLSTENLMILKSMIEIDGFSFVALPRCRFADFKCTEGCRWGAKQALTRLV